MEHCGATDPRGFAGLFRGWVKAMWGAFEELARMLEDSQALKSAAVASDLKTFQLHSHFGFLFHKVVPLLTR